MPTVIRKTIAQKTKTSVSEKKSARKSKKQRVLTRHRTELKEKTEAQICCRCELRIHENEKVLGGSYDGVVCLKHRSCMSCWFDKAPLRGARKHEAGKTKHIGLVDKPFKGTKPLCPGCKKQLPPFDKVKPPTYFEKDNTIHLIDSDTEQN